MMNFNFGGIKGTGPSGLRSSYGTHEGYGANERRAVDTFRAYGSASEGAEDYLSLLVRRYPEAVEAARNADPAAFVQALGRGGSFTGDPESYERSVSQLSRQALTEGFQALGSGRPPGPVEVTAVESSLGEANAPWATPSNFRPRALTPGVLASLLNGDTAGDALQQSDFLSSSTMDRIALLISRLPTVSPTPTENQGR